ncbi:MAG: hypothetical protein AAFO77_08125 [Pseudomonadota bacterium]
MLRLMNIALLAVVLGVATWTYNIKHQADEQLAEIKRLERAIARERDTIELLRADWAYLSSPARLQSLIETYGDELQLAPITPDQLITLSELPERPIFDPGDAVGDIIAGDIDTGVATGSIDANGAGD